MRIQEIKKPLAEEPSVIVLKVLLYISLNQVKKRTPHVNLSKKKEEKKSTSIDDKYNNTGNSVQSVINAFNV